MMFTHEDLMLATAADGDPATWIERESRTSGAWTYSTKVDGIRVLAADGRLITRNGYDITPMFPEISAPDGWWLDTEIAVVDAEGNADFEATNRRAKGGHGGDATLHVFDALGLEDKDLRSEPYHLRWLRLFDQPLGMSVEILPIFEDGAALWGRVLAAGGEGIMARRPASTYAAGRSSGLVKLKYRPTLDVIVVGRTPGNGARATTFGALQVAVIDSSMPAGFRPLGEVGSGFSASDLVELLELLVTGKPFVVEVSSLGFTSTGKLRHGVFHRIRPDVDIMSCEGG